MSRTYHHGLIQHKPWHKHPPGYHWASVTPSWWTRLYMNRPKRCRDARMLKRVIAGSLDADAAPWELGSHKPHNYYW